jgi:photosystem II stability/assembly factor-like uncharacterized protein
MDTMKRSFSILVVLFVSFQLNAQWVEQTSGVSADLVSVSAVDNNVCWISGDGGVVLRTTNGGATWTNVGSGSVIGTINRVDNVYALDANTCLAAVFSSSGTYVYRTSNGGSNWAQVFAQSPGFIDAIWMTSALDGFMVGDPVNSRWSLWKTTTGGASWDSTGLYLKASGNESGWPSSLFINGSNIWFGTNNSRIYYSSDDGAAWTAQATPLLNIYGLSFSGNIGIAGGSTSAGDGGISISTDNGSTWTPGPFRGSGPATCATQGNDFLYITFTGAIYLSNNSGISFQEADSVSGSEYYNVKIARTGNSVWACGVGGIIRKGTIASTPVELTSFNANINNSIVNLNWNTATETNNRGFEIQRKSSANDFITVAFVNGNGTATKPNNYSWSEKLQSGIYSYRLKQVDYNGKFEYSKSVEVVVVPKNFSLEQNFPNPFNPSTIIRYNVPVESSINIRVFNSLGENVREFNIGSRQPGFYDLNFNSNGLTSGVYFYTIQTASIDGKLNFRDTKKMMLLK